jgi:Stress responsive A/B Barrel Domain
LLFASIGLVGLFTYVLAQGDGVSGAQEKEGLLLSHDVYFSLKDNSAAAKKKLVEACKKYLSGHEGEVFFAAGTRAESFKREVNDQDFDVALQIVFKDQAAHDKYQDAKRHLQFIAENKDNLKKVRVFDSFVQR